MQYKCTFTCHQVLFSKLKAVPRSIECSQHFQVNMTVNVTGVIIPWADTFLSSIYIISFLIGIPGNIVAMKYFMKEQKLSSYLFLSTALVDVVGLTVKCIPISVSLLHGRESKMYTNDVACNILGMLQNATIMASVFIVAVLSSTRTYSLLRPLSRVNKKAVICLMLVYFTVLSLHELLPVALGKLKFSYSSEDVICWDAGEWSVYDDIIDSLFLALPIVPITICCIVSCHHVYFVSNSTAQSSNMKLKSSATITIILYTITYIIFNIPNFINYVLWNITSIVYEWPGPLYNTTFMQYYSWNISGELCLVLNSLVNPMIYLLRIQQYRRWVKERGLRFSVVLINENLVLARNSQGNIRAVNDFCRPITTTVT